MKRGESMEEEYYEEIEVAAALEGVPEVSEAPNLAHFNRPLGSKAEPHFLKMMEQMTPLIGRLTQEVAPQGQLKSHRIQDSINKGT
ncbi:hypothetical protein O181_026837 [Austropuccinia psidii MF-1]|uniref:Uncharacterized protein n=1 Tax=Austropuccinia psidii MF-1 TaxID=1389203 RepID=A0A9Q3H149_9BASI|nr:hypothetical protein [Austropuccinia psidii MF-1]